MVASLCESATTAIGAGSLRFPQPRLKPRRGSSPRAPQNTPLPGGGVEHGRTPQSVLAIRTIPLRPGSGTYFGCVMAERVGFEPTTLLSQCGGFNTAALSRSATSPLKRHHPIGIARVTQVTFRNKVKCWNVFTNVKRNTGPVAHVADGGRPAERRVAESDDVLARRGMLEIWERRGGAYYATILEVDGEIACHIPDRYG
jgi:hypothetical protein